MIATSSIEEGLDFAANLLCNGLTTPGAVADADAPAVLQELCHYTVFRYVGEPLLALEQLAGLANERGSLEFRADQFWEQLRWVAVEMGLSDAQQAELGLGQ